MKVIASCKISNNGVWVNGDIQPTLSSTEANWKKALYSTLKIDYSKFYKMDALAKMAFLSFYILKDQTDLNQFDDEDVAMIFANTFSSYDNDQKYINSYADSGSPSPSLFVYTLPNILTGELAIFQKWYGENIFFIQEKFNPEFFIDQINFYFSKDSKACLCGWIDSANDTEECLLFLVENTGDELTKEQLLNYYKQ